MSRNDLKGLQPGDRIAYQQPLSKTTACGTFQGWHFTDDGQARLLVHHQQWGINLSVDPKRVVSITHQNEDHP
jgi:hypothetical protein